MAPCRLVDILMASHHRMEDTNNHHMDQVLHLWDLNLPWVHNLPTCTCNTDSIRILQLRDHLGLTVELILDPCMDSEEDLPWQRIVLAMLLAMAAALLLPCKERVERSSHLVLPMVLHRKLPKAVVLGHSLGSKVDGATPKEGNGHKDNIVVVLHPPIGKGMDQGCSNNNHRLDTAILPCTTRRILHPARRSKGVLDRSLRK